MDTSLSMKSVIVAEDIYVSLLPNSASRWEKGQSREKGRETRGTKKRKEGLAWKLKLKDWKKAGEEKAWRWENRGQREEEDEEEEEGSRDKGMTTINLVLFAGRPV